MKSVLVLAIAAIMLLMTGSCAVTRSAKWEYKVVRLSMVGQAGKSPEEINNFRQSFLNEMGRDGWVLILISDGGSCYFKRAVK